MTVRPGGHARDLTGAGDASGYVAVGPSTGATEPVVVTIAHLDPAPADAYYQISFQTRGKPVPGAIFNPACSNSFSPRGIRLSSSGPAAPPSAQ